MVNINNECILASCNPVPLSFLQYQLVFYYTGEDKFLKSFNILQGNKIIKKFYLEKMLPFSENLNVQQVILNMLIKEKVDGNPVAVNSKSTKWQSKSNSPKPNPDARARAASDLFSNLGL